MWEPLQTIHLFPLSFVHNKNSNTIFYCILITDTYNFNGLPLQNFSICANIFINMLIRNICLHKNDSIIHTFHDPII